VDEAGIAGLMARHLRLHGALLALLALRAQTGELAEGPSAEQWLRWLSRREVLLQRVAELGAPVLAAETAEVVAAKGSSPALAQVLTALCDREVEMLRAAARENERLEVVARARYGALLARLRGAGGARAARRGYRSHATVGARARLRSSATG
jgi:hypothetical protein